MNSINSSTSTSSSLSTPQIPRNLRLRSSPGNTSYNSGSLTSTSPACSINKLPSHLIGYILGFASFQEVITSHQLVQRQWTKIAATPDFKITDLTLKKPENKEISSEIFITKSREVFLGPNVARLKRLSLENLDIDGPMLKAILLRVCSITTLHLRDLPFIKEVSSLSILPNLTRLTLVDLDLKVDKADKVLSLPFLPKLRYLDLYTNEPMLINFNDLPNIINLQVHGKQLPKCRFISNPLSKLRTLALNDVNLDNSINEISEIFKQFSRFINLKLRCVEVKGNGLTFEDLIILSESLTCLQKLNTSVFSSHFVNIFNFLPNLTQLCFNDYSATSITFDENMIKLLEGKIFTNFRKANFFWTISNNIHLMCIRTIFPNLPLNISISEDDFGALEGQEEIVRRLEITGEKNYQKTPTTHFFNSKNTFSNLISLKLGQYESLDLQNLEKIAPQLTTLSLVEISLITRKLLMHAKLAEFSMSGRKSDDPYSTIRWRSEEERGAIEDQMTHQNKATCPELRHISLKTPLS